MSQFPRDPADPGAVHAAPVMAGVPCGAEGPTSDTFLRINCRSCLERAQAKLDRLSRDRRDRRALGRPERTTPAC